MNYKIHTSLLVSLSLTAFSASAIKAETPSSKKTTPNISIIDNSGRVNVNNIDMVVTNHGSIGYDIANGNSGLFFPNGQTDKAVVFASGLWLGAKDQASEELLVRVGEYSQTFSPGEIKADGSAADPSLAKYKVYKINKGDNASTNEDWANWPCDLGAPCEADGVTPKVLGDQTLWSVYNDIHPNTPSNDAASIASMGIEVRQTVFAFNRSGALGNVVFVKYQFFNKGTKTLTDMYSSIWSDPDLGGAADDYVGSDVDLSLGYTYNADNDDSDYGSSIPAVGYDFFQGPLVSIAGETYIDNNSNGIFDAGDDALTTGKGFDKEWPGFKNLPMASFNKYINGTDPSSPEETYNYMQGLLPDGSPYINPVTGQPTTFTHTGNPVSRQGDLDFNPADRRLMLSAGPFTMAPGESQEVVTAIIIGQCGDNLVAVDHLKSFDKEAQTVFDNNFSAPSPPDAPIVTANALDRKITMDWYASKVVHDAYPVAGVHNADTYSFEGYNIYQGESVSGPWKKIATYDDINGVTTVSDEIFDESVCELIVKPIQKGTDNGIKYSFEVKDDFLLNEPLKNGTDYFFSVTAYAVDPNSTPNNLESAKNAMSLRPQGYGPGSDFSKVTAADSIFHISGNSDGVVNVDLIHDNLITGNKYQVTFFEDTLAGETAWRVTDIVNNKVVIDSVTNQGAEGDFNYPISDGIQVRVAGPPFELKEWNSEGTRWISGTDWGGSQLFGGAEIGHLFFGSTLDPGALKPIKIEWYSDQTKWSDAQVYWRDSGYAAQGVGKFPGQAFDISDPNSPRRVNICFVENDDGTGTAGNHNLLWDMGLTKPDGTIHDDATAPANGGREYLFFMDSDYNGGVDYDDDNWGPSADVNVAVWPKIRGSLASHPYQQGDFALTFVPNIINTPNDVFEFQTVKPVVEDLTKASKDLGRITPVPNPYYGRSDYENPSNNNDVIIRFVNLPENSASTIRIFNLAGDLVKKIEKPASQGVRSIDWNGTNKNNLVVASGVYIYHVKIDGVGETTGKMICVFRKQFPNNF